MAFVMRVGVRVGIALRSGLVVLGSRVVKVRVVPMGPGVGVGMTQRAMPVQVAFDALVNGR